MAQQTLADRVGIIERKVTSLEKLPARMDALELQILQFREEVRVEFSAVRTEMKAGDEETRREISALGTDASPRNARDEFGDSPRRWRA